MTLTLEQLAEGRRLLAEYESAGSPVHAKIILALEDWLWEHRQSLLAEPSDPEAIKRAAVREFARKLASKFGANAQSWSVLANVDSLPAGRELALVRSDLWLAAADEVMVAACGAKLEEKS